MKMLPGKYIYQVDQPIGQILGMYAFIECWSKRLRPIELEEFRDRHAKQKRRGIPEYVFYDKDKNRLLLHPVPLKKGDFVVRFTPPALEI